MPFVDVHLFTYSGAYRLSANHLADIAPVLQVEHHQRQIVVHGQGDSRHIHNLQLLFENRHVGGIFDKLSRRVRRRIGRVKTVDLGGFEQYFGMDLLAPEHRRGIGCKIRTARPTPEDNHPAFFKMPYGTAQDIRLGHFMHRNGRLDPGLHTFFLQGILQGQAVDHGSQHPHVVGRSAIHVIRTGGNPTENIPPADHDGDFHPKVENGANLFGHILDHIGADTEALISHQGFTTQLQQDALVP